VVGPHVHPPGITAEVVDPDYLHSDAVQREFQQSGFRDHQGRAGAFAAPWNGLSAREPTRTLTPADIEGHVEEFTQLAACTIAQAEDRAELIASRTRLVMASDEARHHLERDLHDGAQQRLISLGLTLQAAQANAPPENEKLLSQATEQLSQVQAQIQEISHGLHPSILGKGGLCAAIKALTRRFPVATELDIDIDRRLPDPIEVTVYYVASEALTNVLKHADASLVSVELHIEGGFLHLTIRDDGIGCADPRQGSGLIGLKDRVDAVGGTMQITSPPGAGTSLHVEIPARQPGTS
jgi:signal transduction histidine kinase